MQQNGLAQCLKWMGRAVCRKLRCKAFLLVRIPGAFLRFFRAAGMCEVIARQRWHVTAARSYFLAAMFLAALSLPAQDVVSQPPAAVTGPYKLSGTVVNSATGEPVRRALATIHLGRNQSALTDSDGRFEFDNLPEGQTAIDVQKPGFFSEEQVNRRRQAFVRVGPEADPPVIKLYPEGIIFGRVEADGEPLESQRVRVLESEIENGRRVWRSRGQTLTDDEGRFRIANLTPGSYYLAAGPGRRFLQAAGAGKGSYSEAFYPGVAAMQAATPIEIVPGRQVEANLSLPRETLFQISGAVVGWVPSAVGVALTLENQEGEEVPTDRRIDSQSGKFQIQVPAGAYTVHLTRFVPNGQPEFADLPLTVTANVASLRAVLAPRPSIPVVMTTEAVNPPPQGSQVRTGNAPPASLLLFSTTPSLTPAEYSSMQVGNGKSQSLAVPNIAPGTYSAEIIPSYPWYVASALCGATDLLREDLTVPEGGGLPPIEIVLRNDGASLSGTISENGAPTEGTVLLIPAHGTPKASASGQSAFQFNNVAPGDYAVIAFDRVDHLEYANPAALQPYMAQAGQVTLTANGKSEITLNLIHVGQ